MVTMENKVSGTLPTNPVSSTNSNVLKLHPVEMNRVVPKKSSTSTEFNSPSKENTENMASSGKILLPVKKRKVEGLTNNTTGKRQRVKSVSQKQCKLDFPPCRICNGRGSGLHYGVNSCESCKSFFRRCLTRKEEYKCSKNSDCPVTSQVRGNCSGCRYQRCQEVGMSREAACLGRYTLSRRTQTIMEAKGESLHADYSKGPTSVDNSPKSPRLSKWDSSESSMSDAGTPSRSSSSSLVHLRDGSSVSVDDVVPSVVEVEIPADGNMDNVRVHMIADEFLTAEVLEELKLTEKLVAAMEVIKPFGGIVTEQQIKTKIQEDYDSYMSKTKVFGDMKPVPKGEYIALLETTGIDIDGRQEFLRQSALSCQPVLHSYIAFANIVPGFSTLSLEDQCNLLKTSHFEVFLVLTYKGYDSELEMILTETGKAYHINQAADIFYSRNLIVHIFDVCKKIQALQLSKEETAFLLAIAVTFGDRCQLEDASTVDEIQLKIVRIFQSYLQRTRPDDASRFFTKVVDCFIAMRAVNDQYLKEYGVICQDKLVQKEAPIWLAYINSANVKKAGQAANQNDSEETETSEENV